MITRRRWSAFKRASSAGRRQAALRKLYAERQALEDAFKRAEQTLAEALTRRTGVAAALLEHDAFFRHISEERKKLALKISEAEAHRDRCRDTLVGTMKELKAYKNLREDQYLEYLKEVQIESEKEMGDLVSFGVVNSAREHRRQREG